MTSKQELLRQADAKELLAGRFENYAKGLAAYYDRPRHLFEGGRIWRGPAADRFEGDLKARRNELERLEEECLETARRLHRTADDLRRDADKAP